MLGCGDAIKCVVPPQPRRRRIVTLSCVTIRSTGVDVVPSTPPPGVRGFYDFYPHGLPRATGTGRRPVPPRAADVLLRFRFVGREQARAAWNRTLRRRTATVRVASCEVVCR